MATLKGRPIVALKFPLRVQACNLNLEVYVFLGVATVQLGIVCSNCKVQVANLNPPVLVGAVSRRRLRVQTTHMHPIASYQKHWDSWISNCVFGKPLFQCVPWL